MFFTGQFRDIKDNMITVYIQTDNSRSEIVKIGEEGGDIFFDKDPIDITMDVDNTFDVLITKTMELNLLSKKYSHSIYSIEHNMINRYVLSIFPIQYYPNFLLFQKNKIFQVTM